MKGKLTRSLEEVSFEKCPPKLWGAIHTYATFEKTVQTFLKTRGIKSYLPLITHYENGRKTDRMLQTPGYIYACWDCRQHPGLCTARNKIYRDEIHHCGMEDDILKSMIACRKLELISNTYPVEVWDGPVNGEIVTLSDGELAGSKGILKTENGIPFFYLMLTPASGYARIQLDAVGVDKSL